jgi:hypothetical protein
MHRLAIVPAQYASALREDLSWSFYSEPEGTLSHLEAMNLLVSESKFFSVHLAVPAHKAISGHGIGLPMKSTGDDVRQSKSAPLSCDAVSVRGLSERL